MPTSSNRAVVLIAILIVVAVAAGIFFYSNRAQAPTSLPDVVPQESTGDTVQSDTPTTTPTNTPETASSPTATTPATKPAATKPAVKPVIPTFGAVITYTNGGFEPVRATIYKDQTVRFINNSDRDMWVASDIHPQHSGYLIKSEKDCLGSSFDQCKAVSKGGSWDFSFAAVGSWEYHNHMRAVDGGVIYVKERE